MKQILFQITLDSIGDAVICTDNAGNISFLNPAAERMTGWSHIDATGRPLADSFRLMDAATGEVASNPTTTAGVWRTSPPALLPARGERENRREPRRGLRVQRE
jgi:PAS domain-containing protein